MEIDERVKVLETEFQTTKEEIRQILLDIRIYMIEAGSPFQSASSAREASAREEEKGVAPNGNG